MTHPIIKTENYLLVVDKLNCPAKEGQTFLTKEGLIHTNIGWNYGDSVIIYHLPLNNAPTLEGVPLLPPLEDDVEKLASINAKTSIKGHKEQDINTEIWISGARHIGFKEGYNKAKEKYKYTEEDLRKSVAYAISHKHIKGDILINKIIQPLQQPKYPVAFECETELVDNQDFVDFEEDATTLPSSIESAEQPKTITNSQGLTQLVGKYIY